MGFKKKIEDPNITSPQPPTTKKKGDWGERIALEYMVAMGCAIMEQKWKSGHYEVDIIAQKGARIHFVEVKTRTNASYDPAGAVNRNKQRRIILSADAYLRQYEIPFDYQFDIVCVVGDEDDYRVEYIPDAYFPRPR